MSAKSCLLCGKALSRIWVGSGEDFCSREHRNQYRLRRGMDRLLEANKLASLMRRRENLKPIPVPAPTLESSLVRHAFEKTPASVPKPQVPSLRLDPPEPRPRLQATEFKQFVPPPLPATHRTLSVPARTAAKLTAIRRRDLVAVSKGLAGDQTFRELPQAPQRGLDLRVSLGAGFRLRAPVRRELAAPAPAVSPLVTPKPVTRVEPSDVNHRATLLEFNPPFPLRNPERRDVAMPREQPKMRWPGLRTVPVKQQQGSRSTLDAAVPLSLTQQQAAGLSRQHVQPAGLPVRRQAPIFAIPATLSTGPTAARTAAVPFKPAEAPFGYGTEESEPQ